MCANRRNSSAGDGVFLTAILKIMVLCVWQPSDPSWTHTFAAGWLSSAISLLKQTQGIHIIFLHVCGKKNNFKCSFTTDQLRRNILNQNNEVSTSGLPFLCLQWEAMETCPPAVRLFPGSTRGSSLAVLTARLLAERKARYRLLPTGAGGSGGHGWRGDVSGVFWSKQSPPARGNELLVGTDPGNPQWCDFLLQLQEQ